MKNASTNEGTAASEESAPSVVSVQGIRVAFAPFLQFIQPHLKEQFETLCALAELQEKTVRIVGRLQSALSQAFKDAQSDLGIPSITPKAAPTTAAQGSVPTPKRQKSRAASPGRKPAEANLPAQILAYLGTNGETRSEHLREGLKLQPKDRSILFPALKRLLSEDLIVSRGERRSTTYALTTAGKRRL